MQVDEIARVSSLVRSLQAYQKMKRCERLPSTEDFQAELSHERPEDGARIANNFGSWTIVAVDTNRLDDPDKAYIVGYMIYSRRFSVIHGVQLYITSFFIEENFRRHGLGRKFMEFIKLHGRMMGCKNIDVPFMNDNIIGQKFYKCHGAELVNEEYILWGKKM